MSLAEIVEVDYSKLSHEDFVAINNFENELKDEARPEDPKTPLERTIAQLTTIPEFMTFREFWVRDDGGRLVAIAHAMWRNGEENRHLAWSDVSVLADARGRGIGKRLLRQIVDVVKADGRTLMSG